MCGRRLTKNEMQSRTQNQVRWQLITLPIGSSAFKVASHRNGHFYSHGFVVYNVEICHVFAEYLGSQSQVSFHITLLFLAIIIRGPYNAPITKGTSSNSATLLNNSFWLLFWRCGFECRRDTNHLDEVSSGFPELLMQMSGYLAIGHNCLPMRRLLFAQHLDLCVLRYGQCP